MGYVHDTAMSQFIPPEMIGFSATATMAMVVASNVWYNERTANNSTFTVYIPVMIPSCSVDLMGSLLKSIELMYEVAAADNDTVPTVKLFKDTFSPNAASGSGTINTAAEITAITVDAGHDSDAERKVQDEHRMVVTLTTPVWIDNDASYHLEIAFDAAALSEDNFYGAIINYTKRL
jgi:hypothetical protein